MRYHENCKNVIDITKAPYFADNSGNRDCTNALRQAIDDCLYTYIAYLEEMRKELLELARRQGGNVYLGAEAGRVVDGNVYITFPKESPLIKTIYFPNGTYLVSDTVTYTFDNLFSQQNATYTCELCRNIHILGESRENTVIKLADNAAGFKEGTEKPVISFNRASRDDEETTNCAQMNTLEDITIDCGSGNPGAVGVLFAASNAGRIENVTVKSDGGLYGIKFDYSSEGCVDDVLIEGFDYGIKTGHTSPLIFDNIDLSGNRVAGVYTKNGNLNFKNVVWGDIPSFEFLKSGNGRYYVEDENIKFTGDTTGNYVFKAEKPLVELNGPWPKNKRTENFDNWACVDDFGAVGDGKTDSTIAIQNALNSGKEVILFGEGSYVINRTLKVPATVQTIDFMYSMIVPGYSLIIGEMEGMFDICEESKGFLFAQHFCPDERFSGYFRFFKHSAKRPVVLKDISISASLYFNTADGNEVYFDNCFTHTNHYAQDCLHRDGYVPVFCRVIPVELHNQKAYGRNLNIERGETELLNDNSELLVDGYKVEGPGKLVKAVNGSKTQFNLYNAAWWGNRFKENCMFDIENSEVMLTGGNIFCYPEEKELCTAFKVKNGEKEYVTDLFECSEELYGKDALGRDWGRIIKKAVI